MTIAIIDSLRKQIASCEATLQELRQQLAEAEHNHEQQQKTWQQEQGTTDPLEHDMNYGLPDEFCSEIMHVLDQAGKFHPDSHSLAGQGRWPLEQYEYKRYGRQLIMPEIGLQGAYGIVM